MLPRRDEVELVHGQAGVRRGSTPWNGCAIRDRGVQLELASRKTRAARHTAPRRAQVWTRKQAGIAAHGTLALDGGAPRPIEALAVVDDTAGYHARVTEWRWSAGVGEDPTAARWRATW